MELKTKPGSFDVSLSPGLAPRSPEHQGVVQSLFDLPHKMELSVAYRYVSALPAERVGSYGTVDATLRWRPVRDIDFSLAGQNLVQAHHVEYGGLPGPLIGIKRDIFASVTWTK
jgi:outer membrane receptor protein involved in Fe transport